MTFDNWLEWTCPVCGEKHSDPELREHTTCRKCHAMVDLSPASDYEFDVSLSAEDAPKQ